MSSKHGPFSQPSIKNPICAGLEEGKTGKRVPSDPKVVKKMQTHRPFTPCERNRILFCSPDIPSRPASSTISRSYSFDFTERKPLTSIKLQPISNQRIKEVENEDFKSKSSVTKTPLINIPLRKSSAGSRSHSLPSTLPPIIVSGKSILNVATETKPKNNINLPERVCSKEKYEEYHFKEKSKDGELNRLLLQENAESQLNSDSSEFSDEIAELLSPLEDFCNAGLERNVDEAIRIVCELHSILQNSHMQGAQFEHRFTVLKLLFKLLDSNNATLTLNVAKVILFVKVSGKNLMHLCKVLYKISTDNKNDPYFQKCRILGPFLNTIRNIGIENDPDALLYSIGTVKFLSANESILPELYNFDCSQIFLHHLFEVNGMLEKDKKSFSKILNQLIITVRNMTENEVFQEEFINNGALQQIFYSLKVCYKDSEVVLPAIRFMSKVADDLKGCKAIRTCAELTKVFTDLLKIHNMHLSIIVRVGYVIGNLVSDDSSMALEFCHESDFLSTLLSVVDDYVHLDLKRKEMGLKTIVYKEKLYDFEEKQWKEDVPDIIVKMIRILANMCLHSDIGSSIAIDQNCITNVVKILDAYQNQDMSQEESWVPFISVLIAVNNMTYFMDNTQMSSSMITLTQCILPFLNDMYDFQLRLETCSIMGNLTRSPDVRMYILGNNFLPLLVSLLDVDDKEMLYIAYGVIMNIVIDQSSRKSFYKENGVTKLLHRLHLCLDRDWEMVALLCQILWNYCGGNDALFIHLSTVEAQHLIKVLAYSIRNGADIEKDDEGAHQAWKEMFCPIAEKLLHVLKSKTSFS